MSKELVLYPDDVLRVKSDPVKEFGGALKNAVAEMEWVARNLGRNAIGIAGVQCRVLLRVGLVWPDWTVKKPGKYLVMCNPEVVDQNTAEDGEEGCLSFPGEFLKVRRPTLVRVRYQDREGLEQYQFFHRLYARCVLHEIDHMNGVLFIDHATKETANV